MPRKSQDVNIPEHADLGRLYGEIKLERKGFEGEKKLEKRELHPFVKFCRGVHKSSPGLGGKHRKFKPGFREAVDFLGWDLKPEELAAAASLTLIVSLVVFVGIGFGLYALLADYLAGLVGEGIMAMLYMVFPGVVLSLFLTYYVQNYPLEAAREEQVKALTYVPEIMGYMIMSMKLVPNLEKAVEFAAERGRGKIADDFKKLLWDLELGVYNTLSEGLDELALKWGKFSQEFKESIMAVRSSVLEDTEAKRNELLDKTMESLLESVKNRMEDYARSLSQPSTGLFYLGVLLPLILIIILPVGSAFSGQALARPEILIFVYNIALPIAALVLAKIILKNRPPTYEPPRIPDDYPGLPKKGTAVIGGAPVSIAMLVVFVLVLGFGASFYVHSYGIGIPDSGARFGVACILPTLESRELCALQDKSEKYVLAQSGYALDYFSVSPPGPLMERKLASARKTPEIARHEVEAERYKFYLQSRHDVSPNTLVFGMLMTIALALFIYIYYSSIYKRRAQLEVMRVESEFKEALYFLASRMGENKPVEDAMKHVRDFLPTYKVSRVVFGKTVHNIEVLGMPLESAVFDSTYGSLKNLPSPTIWSGMKLVVDSVRLGVGVAARTIASLSRQLTNQEKVTRLLKTMVSEVTQMMRMMSTFIAPAILGVTTALQRIVMLTLANTVTTSEQVASSAADTGMLGGLQSLSINAQAFQLLANPTQFMVIVAVYVIEIVIILMYFSAKVEEDNDLGARVEISKALPIAILVFLAATIGAGMVVGNFYG